MDKVWLVTGSASGFGRNIAEAVLESGDRLLVLHDRTSGWVDLGSPARVLDTLHRNAIEPQWVGRETLSWT